VGLGVADCWSAAAAAAAAAAVEGWKDAGVGVVGVSTAVVFMLNGDEKDKRID
jgi:hypothetical protein